jgi:hypothetical protein
MVTTNGAQQSLHLPLIRLGRRPSVVTLTDLLRSDRPIDLPLLMQGALFTSSNGFSVCALLMHPSQKEVDYTPQ